MVPNPFHRLRPTRWDQQSSNASLPSARSFVAGAGEIEGEEDADDEADGGERVEGEGRWQELLEWVLKIGAENGR